MQYLFERLANGRQDVQYPLTKEELQINVMRQIQCIVASHPWLCGDDTDHLLSFGQPVVPDLSAGNAQQLRYYGERLKHMIARYEPRLENPEVTLEPSATPSTPVKVVVAGRLQAEGEVLPVLMASEPRLD